MKIYTVNIMKKRFFIIFLVLMVASIFLPAKAFTASSDTSLPSDIYMQAKVISVSSVTTSLGSSATDGANSNQSAMTAELKIISGPEKGRQISAQYELGIADKLNMGDHVIVDKPGIQDNAYYIVDPYRINSLVLFILLFFAVAIYFGRRRGIFVILGLAVSIIIIFYYLVPSIIAGGSPLGVSLVGAFFITVISLFVSHGISRRTAIAFTGTIISLAIAVVTDLLMVYSTKLTGTGSESAVYLQFGNHPVDLQGIVLVIAVPLTTFLAACYYSRRPSQL